MQRGGELGTGVWGLGGDWGGVVGGGDWGGGEELVGWDRGLGKRVELGGDGEERGGNGRGKGCGGNDGVVGVRGMWHRAGKGRGEGREAEKRGGGGRRTEERGEVEEEEGGGGGGREEEGTGRVVGILRLTDLLMHQKTQRLLFLQD